MLLDISEIIPDVSIMAQCAKVFDNLAVDGPRKVKEMISSIEGYGIAAPTAKQKYFCGSYIPPENCVGRGAIKNHPLLS